MVPKYVQDHLAKKFTPEQVEKICQNWDTYIQISFSNSSARELTAAGRTVLQCLELDAAK